MDSLQAASKKVLAQCDVTTPDLDSAIRCMKQNFERLLDEHNELKCTLMKPYIATHGLFKIPDNIYIAVSRGDIYVFSARSDGMTLIADSKERPNESIKAQANSLTYEIANALPGQKLEMEEALGALKLAESYKRPADNPAYMRKMGLK